MSTHERSTVPKYQEPACTSLPPTPNSPQTVSLRSYIESVVRKSRIDTGTLLCSLAYARRLRSKLFHTSKGKDHNDMFVFYVKF